MSLAKGGWSILVCSVLLAGCSSDKPIVSRDNSVDYRTARALPPLTKVVPDAAPMASPVVSTNTIEPSSATPVEGLTTDSVASDLANQDQPLVDSFQVSNDDQAESFESTPVPSRANAITSRIISSSDNTARLSVDAPLNTAWSFVVAEAKTAGISIFSRDVGNSRMFIGCGDIPQTSSVKKSGKWTFFNREKKLDAAQYCSLKLREAAGKTVVSVLDISGSEVDAEFAEPILTRLIAK